jgi:Flp pilus assembly protein TadB
MSAADRAAKRAADHAERARLLAQAGHDEWETGPGLHHALAYLTLWAGVGVCVVAVLTATWTHRLDPLLWWLVAVTAVCGLLAWRTRRRL